MSKIETRRIPIDFSAVAEEAGLRAGTLCKHAIFGWGVQKQHVCDDGPDFGCVTPPALGEGETDIWIEGNHWCFGRIEE